MSKHIRFREDRVVDGRSLVRREDQMDLAVVGLDGIGIGIVAGAFDEIEAIGIGFVAIGGKGRR